jgi:hypothetical protein
MYFYHTDIIVLRQALASSFVLLTLYNIENNSIKFAIITFLSAISFHVSSILLIIIIFTHYIIPFNKKLFSFVLLISIIISFNGLFYYVSPIIITILPDSFIAKKLISNIVGSLNYNAGIFRGTVLFNLIFIIYFLKNLNLYSRFKFFKIFYISYFYSFIFLLVFNDLGVLSDRLFFMFSITFPILLSYIVKFVHKDSRTIFILLLIICIFVLFLNYLKYYDEYIFIGSV